MNDFEWRMGDTMGELPTGTVTFVLGDVVGSTAMWEAAPDSAAQAIAGLDGLVDKLVDRHDGAKAIEQGEGDSFVAAFARAADAARFAVELQRSIGTLDWPDDARPALRLALHTGEARLRDGLYRGEPLNRCARIRALAHGGQILVSGSTAELVVDGLGEGEFLKDLGVHRLRDLSRPDHLRQLCGSDLRIDFPQLASLDRMPNNLPLQLTSFVGRDHEMAAVSDLLSTERLVTLTGAGGSGKTRLAMQVAASTLDHRRDGSWLVDLAAVSDASQVARAIAEALGVHEMPLQDVATAIEVWLRDRQLLLLVDNCEHVIDACASIASRLLASCPDLSVLATSREPLGIAGETTYRVPSLALPDDDDLRCASVELFAARAAAVRPTFRLGPENAAAVASICRRLDGLPLAIELAAARCRALSPSQIAEQISDRLSLLSGGTRNALPRQRTLEASVAWSFDLLDDEERAVLRRLSVFSGSFSLEAAEAVGALADEDAWRVVDIVTGLVDKSLVLIEEHEEIHRYRLLETVRHFAAQQLVAVGESEATRDAHASHYFTAIEDIAPDLIGPMAMARYAELDRDRTNVVNALDWLVHRQRGNEGIALAARLARLWSRLSSVEVLERLERVLLLDGGDPRDRARVMMTCGEVAWLVGDIEANVRHIDALDEHVHANHLHEMLPYPALLRGWTGVFLGDPAALDLLVESGRALRDCGDFYWSSDAHFGAANILMERGDYAGAEGLMLESEQDAQRSRDPVAIGRAIVFHAMNRMQLGDLDGAEAMLDDVGARQRQVADASVQLFGGAIRAWCDASRGHFDASIETVAEVVSSSQRIGLPMAMTWAQWVGAMARRNSAQCEGLDEYLAECGELMGLTGLAWGTAWCGGARAELALARGDLATARTLVDSALEFASTRLYARYGTMRCLLTRARIRRAADEPGAEFDAREALAMSAAGGSFVETLESLELLATFAVEFGDAEGAARLLGAAAAIRTEKGFPLPPVAQPEIDGATGALIAVLGTERLAELLAEGAQLDLAGAVAYAGRGHGTRKRPATGWRSLTPAEVQVVELVAEGCTNAEIGRRLFVSVATVKTHLAHVFTKLSISTRAELAARAARRE
jgi:predicted ATPase/class 3 adenylate cyclase/DNA-binding CsgD family transcriptional regulator